VPENLIFAVSLSFSQFLSHSLVTGLTAKNPTRESSSRVQAFSNRFFFAYRGTVENTVVENVVFALSTRIARIGFSGFRCTGGYVGEGSSSSLAAVTSTTCSYFYCCTVIILGSDRPSDSPPLLVLKPSKGEGVSSLDEGASATG